jgi:hypothetical protein
MGFDKLITFFNKNLPNISDELYDIPQVVSTHIFFDMNFLIYNSISLLEEEINKIIMLINGVSYTDTSIINTKLKNIFEQIHWVKLDIDMNDILDGNTINEIITKFKKIVDDNMINLLSWHIYSILNKNITSTHILKFIKSINLFFDGIPTYGKILEQRRRRMKNYLDSKNRKEIFKDYFKNIIDTVITDDDITFDYFEWINCMYSFDKSIGPYSKLLLLIGEFIEFKLKDEYNLIKIYVDKSTNYGESDYKIFKYIIDNKIEGDIAIHSCDSDFVFLILWYQLYAIVKNNFINISLINYTQTKNGNIRHLYLGKKIITTITERYMNINNMSEDASINIVFDFLCILLLFGNDIMPPSYELGFELNLKHLFETHYQLYCNSNFIINLNNISIINFNNLIKWLEAIKNINSFSIIILNRFYKLPYNNILSLVEQYKNINNISKEVKDLIVQDKGFYINKNSYQSLYNYIVYKADMFTDDIFNRPFKIFYKKLETAYEEYIMLTQRNNVEQYLELYVSFCQIFFYDFNLYTPFNLLYYGDMIAPSIDMIVSFVQKNDMSIFQKKCATILSTFNLDNYFNPISHHLFITPYLLDNMYSSIFQDITHIESMLNVINSIIDGIWYKPDKIFNLKNINPKQFIEICNEMILFYKNNFIDKLFIDNNKLIDYKI